MRVRCGKWWRSVVRKVLAEEAKWTRAVEANDIRLR